MDELLKKILAERALDLITQRGCNCGRDLPTLFARLSGELAP